MSGLKIGLVASYDEESQQLVQLLEAKGARIVHNISPDQIAAEHIGDDGLHVWLLNVADESWHDAVDHLLDETEIPVYFSEPGTLSKQPHKEFWTENLLLRLYEITGLERGPNDIISGESAQDQSSPEAETEQAEQNTATSAHASEKTETEAVVPSHSESDTPLSKTLEELEGNAVGLPQDIAAELVSELESISPVLTEELPSGGKGASESLQVETSTSEDLDNMDSFSLDDDLQLDDFEMDSDLSLENEQTDQADSDISGSQLEPPNETIAEKQPESGDDFLMDETPSLDMDLDSDASNKAEESGLDIDLDIGDDLAFELEEFELPDDEEAAVEEELTLEPEPIAPQLESQTTLNIEQPEAPEPDADSGPEATASPDVMELAADLELMEEEDSQAPVANGKASYAIDEGESLPEEIADSEQPESEVESTEPEDDSGGLSLEALPEEQQISGKADFLGEEFFDAESETEEAETDEHSAEEASTEQVEVAGDEDSQLSLEAIDSEGDEPDWLKELNEEPQDETEVASDEQAALPEIEVESEAPEEEFSFDLEAMEESPASEANSEQTEDIETKPNDAVEQVEALAGGLELEAIEEPKDDTENELTGETIAESANADDRQAEAESVQSSSNQQAAQGNDTLSLETAEISDFLDDVELDTEAVQQVAEEALTGEDQELEFLDQAEAAVEPVIETEAVVDEELEFDIPMLDEAAVDMEFEELSAAEPEASPTTPCWVIGASLGGPAAVKRFLHCIPADINASFVIAQHIDENFLPVLADILTSNSHFEVKVAQGSNDLTGGSVYLAPLKGKLTLLQDGSMLVDRSQKWAGPYSPCINEVIESVAQVYGDCAGAIIFSGMGEDGLEGARKMRDAGGQIWAQSVDTCANASMPEAIINNLQADFIGSPEQLAEQLVRFLHKA